MLKVWSRSQALIALPSGESELAVVTKAVAETLGKRSLVLVCVSNMVGLCEPSRSTHFYLTFDWSNEWLSRWAFLPIATSASRPIDLLLAHSGSTSMQVCEDLIPAYVFPRASLTPFSGWLVHTSTHATPLLPNALFQAISSNGVTFCRPAASKFLVRDVRTFL